MRQLQRWRFRRTTLWLIGCLAIIAGLGLARFGWAANSLWGWCGLIFLILTCRRRSVVTVVAVGLCGLALGSVRGALYQQHLGDYQALYGQEVTLTVRAADDAVYGTNSQLSFDGTDAVLDDGQALTGKLEISGFGLNAAFQNDTLQVSGKLRAGYGSYQGDMSFAELGLVEHHPSVVADIRRKFTAGMQSALPEPLAPFAMGLLIGQRATLPADVKQSLLMVGLTHIIAVSGYNLTIILQASRRLFAKRSKHISTAFSLSLIAVFLLVAGSSASIIRAAIVSMLTIWASYYGRSVKPLLLISLAAAITAWANPYYVWFDPSWYLSFLAFYGVLMVAPALEVRWVKPRWQESVIVGVALESICAELMSVPFILFTFGQVSFIGLPANVLVVTLVPLAMLLSAVAGLAGMLAGAISGWFAWPAKLLLTYMLDISQVLSRVPHIFQQQLHLDATQAVVWYGVIVGLSVILWRQTKRRERGIITDTDQANEV